MPVETELRLADDLITGLLDGTKTVTIRNGRRDFAEEITIAGFRVRVDSVEHYTLDTCPLTVLLDDGFHSFEDALNSMRHYYPHIMPYSPVTVVRFHLCKFATLPVAAGQSVDLPVSGRQA